MKRPTTPAQRTPAARPEPVRRVAAQPAPPEPEVAPAPLASIWSSPPDPEPRGTGAPAADLLDTEALDADDLSDAAVRGSSARGAAASASAPPDVAETEPVDLLGRRLLTRFEAFRGVVGASRRRRRAESSEARRFTRRSRQRRLIWLVSAGTAVGIVLLAVLAAFSPLMALRHIEVEGTSRLKPAEVTAALQDQLGKPLPFVSSAGIRHDLDDFRLIESYRTELRPPATLVVRITERTPIAVVRSGASWQLLDQAGVVISSTATAPKGYPVITLEAGEQPQSSSAFAATTAVLAVLPAAVRTQVTGAGATSAEAVTLTLAGGKSVVWGGSDQPELKSADLQALLKGAPSAHVYDVSSPDGPVTR